MSMRSLESAITTEARIVFNNKKLRIKDLLEWSTCGIAPRATEVVELMPSNKVYVAISVEHDKRAPKT